MGTAIVFQKYSGQDLQLTTPISIVSKLRMSGSILLLPTCAFLELTVTTLALGLLTSCGPNSVAL